MDANLVTICMMGETKGKDYRTAFGRWLRQEREARGITGRGLGDMVGLSHNAIYMYENGLRFPEPDTMIEFSAIFGVPPEELYRIALSLPDDDMLVMNEKGKLLVNLIRRMSEDKLDLHIALARAQLEQDAAGINDDREGEKRKGTVSSHHADETAP